MPELGVKNNFVRLSIALHHANWNEKSNVFLLKLDSAESGFEARHTKSLCQIHKNTKLYTHFDLDEGSWCIFSCRPSLWARGSAFESYGSYRLRKYNILIQKFHFLHFQHDFCRRNLISIDFQINPKNHGFQVATTKIMSKI